MEHQSSERCVVIIFAEIFCRPVFVKKADIFDFFSNTFDIPHCPLLFVIVTFIFYEPPL